jgi:hypothetical protein
MLVLLSVAAVAQVFAQSGSLDPAFAKVPFDQWFAGGEQAQIRWTARVSQPQLSSHQRLLAQVELQLDGADIAKRRGKGLLVMFVQLNDEEGLAYQNHGTIDLEKIEEGIKSQYLSYTQSAFVLPGDYRISLAIFDTVTGEHSVRREKLHVSPLKNDRLPDAWRDLPPVEFVPNIEPPDSWYLPMMTGRLHLPVETRHPARIEVLVNLTPSERISGPQSIQHRNLDNLIPALKAISQVDFGNAPLHVCLLDLSRRRVIFHQDDKRELDWPRIRDSLSEADPGTIDVKSLEERRHNAGFFVTEVSRRIGADPKISPPDMPGLLRVLIILSSPMEFESGEDLQPIRVGPTPDCRVFYIRYQARTVRPSAPVQPNRGRRSRSGYPGSSLPVRPIPTAQIDQLEPTLKPLAPRLFDVETPEQFRKALATVLAEISGL